MHHVSTHVTRWACRGRRKGSLFIYSLQIYLGTGLLFLCLLEGCGLLGVRLDVEVCEEREEEDAEGEDEEAAEAGVAAANQR